MASSKKFAGKSGTLGSRKKNREFDRLNAEIQNALDCAGTVKKGGEPVADSNEIVVVDANFKREESGAAYRQLIHTLIEWVNSELSSERLIIHSLDEDFYDGLVLAKLVDKLYGAPHLQAMPDVIASEAGQKQRLRAVFQTICEQMAIPEERQSELPWSVDLIHGRSEVALMRLLLTLARHCGAPVRLPDSLPVQVVIVQRLDGGVLQSTRQEVDIAVPLTFTLARGETDAFDVLFEQTPDKIPQVTHALSMWLTNHLRRLGVDMEDDLSQLSDGAYLVMLVGLLEGFYVPLYAYNVAPRAADERSANVRLAFELLSDAGVELPARVRPADIVNADLRSIVRFVYQVFQFYSNRERERAYAATLQQPEALEAECEDAEDVDYDQDEEFAPPPEPCEIASAYQ